jgi:hypothetical protein
MLSFTTLITSTLMLMASLSLVELFQRSKCTGQKMEAQIYRVGAALKNQVSFKAIPHCRGAHLNWSFKGKLNDHRF